MLQNSFLGEAILFALKKVIIFRYCYNGEISPSKSVNMNYPLGTVSKPVSGKEARKLARAVKSDSYVANEAAIAVAKRIAERRRLREAAHVSQQ
jgi:hypothetical protein